ncbi:MAG: tRNA 2-thiouridine(34) synthase MnmA [Oscillospiraceae bacterium]|nr:tRNA 2-thiouridine(34) synthase MnmA [Oscillospiraceae bacterium]
MRRVLVAMSGGVDSSVTAWLLQQAGYDCAGATMRLYRSTDLGEACHKTCCTETDIEDAGDVAFRLGIPFEVLDYTPLFRERVIRSFLLAYEQGLTPNPCIDCNRYLKFEAMLDYALQHGFDAIATGHYARVVCEESSGRWQLKKALDESKDQSYVLYMLTQEQLAHLLLPLGERHKTEIRAVAEEQCFINARKRESQDICFVPDGDYAAFLERWSGKIWPEGDILDIQGKVLGRHRGALRYTVGQRRGLDLPMGERVYVCAKDMEHNTVTVGPESALYSPALLAGRMNWLSIPEPSGPIRVSARTRYRQTETPATATPLPGGRMRLVFDEPKRAVTAGQAVVLYDGDLVLGGGTILEAIRE